VLLTALGIALVLDPLTATRVIAVIAGAVLATLEVARLAAQLSAGAPRAVHSRVPQRHSAARWCSRSR
jgi:hypothetical protein